MLAAVILLSYVLGSVPFGLVVGRLKGIDVRTAGSGNIGATNVGRLLGKRYFWLVFVLDAAKGLLPMLAGAWVVAGWEEAWPKYVAWLACGLGAMLGHVFPVFLGFRGGKGVATGLGVMLGVWPYYTLAAVPTVSLFVAVFAVSRYISLSSVVSAMAFPLVLVGLGWLLDWQLTTMRWPLVAFAVAVAALVVWRHRGNLARLRAGTEPKFVGGRSRAGVEPTR
ncbi:MAG: glycerol-3-phosphate 1-O-acyltransferase PlsY [Tepidisphaerales bacterium]